MPVEHINPTDSLNTGRVKLNAAIDQSNDAITKATSAVATANQAKSTADNVQAQFNQVVIEGDSSVEAAQARVDADGNVFTTLKERLDTKEQSFSAQLADTAKKNEGIDTIELSTDGTDQASKINTYITNLGNSKRVLYIRNGIYDISSNVTFPSNISLLFAMGAKFRINTGATLEIKGTILNGNLEVFEDGGGIVKLDNSPNEYNLGWFNTTNGYINERWDFAKRGMSSFRKKIIRIPKPYENQNGTVSESGRIYWLFGDEIKIEDSQNTCTFYIDGEFKAAVNCTNFLNIEDVSKPENIYFYGDLNVLIPSTITVNNGINIKSGARVVFWGNVVINGAKTSVKIGGTDQVAPVSDVRFFELQCSFFSNQAVLIHGTNQTVQGVTIDNLNMTAAQLIGLNGLEIIGLCRDIVIDSVFYATDIPKDGFVAEDIENVVYIQSIESYLMSHVFIDKIYQANGNNGLKITGANFNDIRYITINNIFGKYNGQAADIDYCFGLEINNIENNSSITIGTNAYYVNIKSGSGLKSVTDNGNYTLINGLGKQSRGSGVLPSASLLWPIGSIIRETSDNKIYIRIQNTGVDSSDFIALN